MAEDDLQSHQCALPTASQGLIEIGAGIGQQGTDGMGQFLDFSSTELGGHGRRSLSSLRAQGNDTIQRLKPPLRCPVPGDEKRLCRDGRKYCHHSTGHGETLVLTS